MAAGILNPVLWSALAALSFALLGAAVLLAGGGVLVRRHLLLLAGAGILWGVGMAQPGHGGLPAGLTGQGHLLQVLLLVAWYALLHRLLRGPYEQSMPDVVRRGLWLFWAVAAVASAGVLWLGGRESPQVVHTALCFIGLAAALVCFALTAQVARDAPIEGGQALRLLVASTGVASGSQVVLLTVAGLGGGTPPPLIGLAGLAQTASALLLLSWLRLKPQWSLAIFVSPQARSYGPRFLVTGLLLLLVLALLPLFRSLLAPRAQELALLMIVATGAPLATLLLSGRLSARLRVFLSKHFLPFRYDYREEWLRLVDTLVSPEEDAPLPERAVRAVAQIVDSPAGVLWMRQSEQGPFAATHSWNTRTWPESRVPPTDPAVTFMLERRWIIDTAELSRRPELYGGLTRPEWLASFPEGLLIVPLISNETLIGFIVLLQSSSAFRLSFEAIDLLRSSGRQVAAFLAQYELDQKLAEARQFEAFNRLTAFVMHDLKNLIAQQSLMLKNAARHKGNPDFFEDAMATVDNSVARMHKLLQQLQSGDTSGPLQWTRIGPAVRDAVERCRGREPAPQFRDESADLHVWIDRERFTTVITHLIRNAQEATQREGSVRVSAAPGDQDTVEVRIEDDGCGMDQEFIRTRLFRPFDTTKGSKGMGIGAYQARMFIADAGGSLRVESVPEEGTRFIIQLPLQVQGNERGSEMPVPG